MTAVLDAPAIQAGFITMTPEYARQLLDDNNHNRPARRSVLNALVRDIEAGRWVVNGDTIKVALDGTLLDGQHRLLAIVATNIAVETFIVYGLESGSQETVDTGMRRSLSDALHLRGETNTAAVAGTINLYLRIKLAGLDSHNNVRPSVSESMLFYEQHSQLVVGAANLGLRLARAGLNGGAGWFGSLFLILRELDATDADDFFEKLRSGHGLHDQHPAHRLRTILLDRDRMRSYHPNMRRALFIKAWNAYRRGESISLLRWSTGGAHPEAFPLPV